MTRLLKRVAAVALGGVFALSAVSFGDFLSCNTIVGARIEERQERRRSR